MVSTKLICHRETPSVAVTAIAVEVSQSAPDQLRLRYTVTGDISGLYVPPRLTPARTDNLWQTTCFEVFIRPVSGDYYDEFNLSPDTRWAAYAFDGHRLNARDLAVSRAPEIMMTKSETELVGDCLITLPRAYGEDSMLGLTTVIVEADGTKSFWALAHPEGAPEFHDANCFTARLPAFAPDA